MKKILLIDDDADFVESTRMVLEGKPYKVVVANNGDEGVRKAKEEKPDLILLDIIMPVKDGFSAAEQLKKGHPVDGATVADARPVMHAMTENVLLEIQKTFDFFKATASSDRIDKLVLSGGASRTEGFREALKERFGVEVEDFDPFRTIEFDAGKFGVEAGEAAPTAAVAVGLALRRVGDR